MIVRKVFDNNQGDRERIEAALKKFFYPEIPAQDPEYLPCRSQDPIERQAYLKDKQTKK